MSQFIYFHREQQIIEWGAARNIVGKNAQSTALGQLLKTQKEFDEWVANHSKDDVGDIFVTLAMVTSFMDITVGEVFATLSAARSNGEIDLSEVRQYIDEHGLDATFQQQIHLLREDIQNNDKSAFMVDLFVAMNLLFEMSRSIDALLVDCIDHAWNDIKDRLGKMVHGLFVKQSDIDTLEGLDVKYTELYEQPCFLITNPFSQGAYAKLKEIGFIIEGNRTVKLEK